MRIGCLQFAPHVGDVDNNLNRADAILNKSNPENLDLLVLPEMAFSGYNFSSLQHIYPFLEPTGAGITSVWARTTALKHNCKVVVGYPETSDVSRKCYNSVIMVNEDGETCGHYRKSHLYYTDKTWAQEGDGFFEGTIPGLGKVAVGICMDINPYDFVADETLCEFAAHALKVGANVVIVSMAWLTQEDPSFYCLPKEPDMKTVAYWVGRLEPLIRAETEEEIIVVLGNRTGIEGDAVYTGTSAVLGIHHGVVNVYGRLGRADKELLIVDTENPGIGKLVYRPEGETKKAANAPGSEPHKPTERDYAGAMASSSSGLPAEPSQDPPQGIGTPGPSHTPGVTENLSGIYQPVSARSHTAGTVGVANQDTIRSESRRDRQGGEALDGRSRHQSEPGDFQRRQERTPMAPQAENDDGDGRNMVYTNLLPYSRAGSFTPDLEKLGADLMVFEEEWASRRKRDSLVCHVDEDDYVVLRKDTIPVKKQTVTHENDPRASPRRSTPQQETQQRSKVRSRSASRNAVTPAVLGSSIHQNNHALNLSQRPGRSDSAPALKPETRKGYHGRMDFRDQSPSVRSSRKHHARTGSSAVDREVQYPNETSPSRRRQRQTEMSLNTQRTAKQSPKPDVVTLPIRSKKLLNRESSQDYREESVTSADHPPRSTPRVLNSNASRYDLFFGVNKTLDPASTAEEKLLPPTPKAMVLPSEYDANAGYQITAAAPRN